jgi:pimeloyl-ACP methyl ester carboxylesterase
MQVIERGHGVPLVLIPGIQGRWEYMRPTVEALADAFRVITFSLRGEPTSGLPFDADHGLDPFADQVAAALDRSGMEKAVICGVSFGGLVALRFAARMAERTSALIMASTPGPDWHLRPRHDTYARFPWFFGPLFLAESPLRLRKEIAIAVPSTIARLRLIANGLCTLAAAPLSLSRFAERARLMPTQDRRADAAAVRSPTLIVHGEAQLDHVVPPEGSEEYVTLIRGARSVEFEQTGHLGTITRPQEFTRLVRRFVESARDHSHDSAA